jgi:general secretion pathway protein D
VALVRSLVERLDQPSSAEAAGNIHVVYLKNADAVKLAATLRAAMSAADHRLGARRRSPSPRPEAAPGPLPAAGSRSERATLHRRSDPGRPGHQLAGHHGPEPQYRQLRAVIDQLDRGARRCMSSR